MKEKPTERLIQVSLGVLLIVISGLYLWRNTLIPILRSKSILDTASVASRLGMRYSSWEDRIEDARAKALEAERERQRVEGAVEGARERPPGR